MVFSRWSGGGWYTARKAHAQLRNTLFLQGARTGPDDTQLDAVLPQIDLIVCQVEHLQGDLPSSVRSERAAKEITGFLPLALARRVMDGYVLAETDPRANGWLMLRRRAMQ